jgi:hypothetical protein
MRPYHSHVNRIKVTVARYLPREGEEAMPSHKFKVGDIVTIRQAISRNAPGGVFEVIKQLPGSSEPEYRIKSANEPHERVARESELAGA